MGKPSIRRFPDTCSSTESFQTADKRVLPTRPEKTDWIKIHTTAAYGMRIPFPRWLLLLALPVTAGLLSLIPLNYSAGESRDCRSIPGARCPGDGILEEVTENSDQPMLRNTLVSDLPDGEPVACEHEWIIRHLYYQPDSILPRRIYFASCNQDTDSPSLFVSLSLGEKQKAKNDGYSGALIKSTLNPGTGRLEVERIQRHPECVFMEGIAVSSDCSNVSVLCRRNYGDKDFDHDVLASHPGKDWMTQPKCANHEMWLYEWKNGNIASNPVKSRMHRAVDWGWEYGNNYIRLGDDGTLGMAIKARVADPNGNCHEADAFLVMDRENYTYTNRGWKWACGTGHTIFNRLAYNQESKKYAMMCGTDGSKKPGSLAGLWIRREDRQSQEFMTTHRHRLIHKGGPGAILPLEDGGFLGIVVGHAGNITAKDKVPLQPPTEIGLIRFDREARPTGPVRWIAKKKDVYLGYPQITPLGEGRFLLGYGEMKRTIHSAKEEWSNYSYLIPWDFYLVEVDINGKFLTKPQKLQGTGWGEQDQMVSLGRGRVAWAYIPNPAYKELNKAPECNVDELQLSVYESR